MKKLRLAFAVILVAILFTGCASTKTFTTSWMTSRLQNDLVASTSNATMKVDDLKIVKTGLNTYTGTVTISWTNSLSRKDGISDAAIDVFTDRTTFIYRFPAIPTDP